MEWFLQFVIDTLGPEAEHKLDTEARRRFDIIAGGVKLKALAPGSIAERVLEWYLNEATG